MRLYRAYGLDLASDRPLPLRPSKPEAQPSLTIVYSDRGHARPPSGPDRRELVRAGADWNLRYDNREGGWMAFEYSAGERRLLVCGSVPWEALEGPLTGLVFGVKLRLEGASLLHGACLRVGGRAVAILGGSGHGKSTLAAACLALGAELLTEDLLLLRQGANGFEAEPGAPTLHLLADSWRHLEPRLPPAGDRAHLNGDGKVRLVLPAGSAEPVRLAAVYILEPPGTAGGTRLDRLSGPEAIGRLAGQLYGSAWISPVAPADLAFCARLAREVPVFALSRPWALEGVLETAARLA
ncbi:MAG TPA: hypothetical protein VF619_13535 [Allosphingosinicella sp.]